MNMQAGGEAVIKALENAAVNYFICDMKNGTVNVPSGVCKRLGCESSDTSFASFVKEILSAEETAGALKMYEYILDGEDTADGFFRRKDSGTHCRISVTVTEKDGDGSPISALGVVEDNAYTDKEREEKELLESSLGLMKYTFYRIGCIDLNRNSMRPSPLPTARMPTLRALRKTLRKLYAGSQIHMSCLNTGKIS